MENLNSFICPSTKNFIRPNVSFTALINGVLLTRLSDLTNNGALLGGVMAPGHSYEVFGAWKNMTAGYIRKTQASLLSYKHKNVNFFDQVISASDTFIIMDAMEIHPAPWNHENWPNPYDGHGKEGGNVVFADGHAEWIGKAQWNYRYLMSEDEQNRPITPFN